MLGFSAVVKLHRDRPLPPVAGGLALDLADTTEVERAAAALVRRRGADATLLVQRQVGRTRVLSLGSPTIRCSAPAIASLWRRGSGAGYAFDLPPLDLPLAHALIARSGAAAALAAGPDQPAADGAAVAETLVRVRRLIIDFSEIASLVLDPLFADADGVLAGDAWLGLRSVGKASTLAISPYPAALVEHVELDGEALTIRPIRPRTPPPTPPSLAACRRKMYGCDFYRASASWGRSSRGLTQVDYERGLALIAVGEADGATVGVARPVREASDGRRRPRGGVRFDRAAGHGGAGWRAR